MLPKNKKKTKKNWDAWSYLFRYLYTPAIGWPVGKKRRKTGFKILFQLSAKS